MQIDDKIEMRTNVTLIKCKFLVNAQNNAQIPLRNHSKIYGAIYNLLFEMDPHLSRKIHLSTDVRPWTYSYLKFERKQPKSEKKGFFNIKKGEKGFFFIKTIDPEIGSLIKSYALKNKRFRIDALNVFIEGLNVSIGNLHEIPEPLNTVTIRLETPTFFYNALEKHLEHFSIETFLNFQCEKFKRLGIVNLDPTELYPYLILVQDYTRESTGYVTNKDNKSEIVPFKGRVGNITFKIGG
ncbi:MAG: hypothetical protein ACTSO6_14545, partial [Promethearchaeota archaeon]